MQMRTTIQTNRTRTAARGFTLLEIMTVAAVVGIMVTIAMPNFLKARATAEQKACIKNLHALSESKQQWGFENKKAATVTPTVAQLRTYFSRNQMPACPSRGTYTLRVLNREPICSRAALGHTY